MAGFKGIILAGGHGSRLYPATKAISKQLLTVFDKPMIYYPLDTLMRIGITDTLLIVNKFDHPLFERLLADGHQLGLNISYAVQAEARGIADALLIGRDFIGSDNVALILGDNIFCEMNQIEVSARSFNSGATVFAVEVEQPGEFGIIELSGSGTPLSLKEKPEHPKSRLAVTGLYLYDNSAFSRAANLKPSDRNELEITDLNKSYLADKSLCCNIIPDQSSWFDCGTTDGLLEAGAYLQSSFRLGKTTPGYIEQSALKQGFIDPQQFEHLLNEMPDSAYHNNLRQLTRL